MLLIDGFGAIISAIMLGTVLPDFQSYVGMPLRELYVLAAIPVAFAIYDFVCLGFFKNDSHLHLKRIAYANIGYCLLSLVMITLHFKALTLLGLTYFGTEILTLVILVKIELKIASRE